MLIKQLLKLTEESMDPGERAVAAFRKKIDGKQNVLVNLSTIHSQRGNGSWVLTGAIKIFPTIKGMANFLAKDTDGGESRILSQNPLEKKDKKILNWPEGHDEQDSEMFTKLALKLDPKVFMKLDCVKDTHDAGDIDGDNYDWLVCVMDGQKRKWLNDVEELIYDSAD